MSKIMRVYYDNAGLPYKDSALSTLYPIVGSEFTGANNTTEIHFYTEQLGQATWVANCKLPNGDKVNRLLVEGIDEDNNYYYSLPLDRELTSVVGHLKIGLNGYAGNISIDEEELEENDLVVISGTPTIIATGVIDIAMNYSPIVIPVSDLTPNEYQQLLALIGTKLGIRAHTERVEELPAIGETNVFYAIYDDQNDPNKLNIYVWNEITQRYVWVGDNTLDLGDYYTAEQGEQFESNIGNRVTSVENELSSVAQGSPKGVYETLSDLQTAFPTGTTGIYVVREDGHWYYWNGTTWTDGGIYQATEIGDGSISYKKLDDTLKGYVENKNIADVSPVFNLINPDLVVYNKSFVAGEWFDTPNYDVSGLIEVPNGKTILFLSYDANKQNPSFSSSMRAFVALNEDGTIYAYDNTVRFWSNTSGSTKYIRITMYSTSNSNFRILMPFLIPTFDNLPTYLYMFMFMDYIPYKNVYTFNEQTLVSKNSNKEFLKRSYDIPKEKLFYGIVNGTGTTLNSTRFTIYDFIPVKKGDLLVINSEEIGVAFTEYDEEYNVVYSASDYQTKNYVAPGNEPCGEFYVVKNDGYIRFHCYLLAGGSFVPSSFGGCITVINFFDVKNESYALRKIELNDIFQSKKARVVNAPINGQDGTFVNDKLWSFADGQSSLGSIKIFDVNDWTYTEKQHQLGHANSVDYNPNNDCIALYSVPENNHPSVVVYKNPEASDTLLLSDENCIVIHLYNNDGFVSTSGSLCWGEANCFIYFIDGVFSDSTETLAQNRYIYKILLGMGDNDLSQDGFGTFISGKANNEYNGTCQIVKTYKGKIRDNVDYYIRRNTLSTPQGMQFDRYIYVGWGTNGHNYLKIALDDETSEYRVVDDFMYKPYSYDGQEISYEPEMLAIKDGKMYCGNVSQTYGTLFTILDI